MNEVLEIGIRAVAIGVSATLVFDAWLYLQQRLRLPTMSFALLGRWIGHLAHGTLTHASIAKSAPIRGEVALGWIAHYMIGIGFAMLLVAAAGREWIREPTFGTAFAVGIATVIAPLFVMQPAMGAGIAASKTPTPLRNCVRSIVNHAIFGSALYVAAELVAGVSYPSGSTYLR